jgi:two-component system phosphate regulon sensor histidine kinase PhoR
MPINPAFFFRVFLTYSSLFIAVIYFFNITLSNNLIANEERKIETDLIAQTEILIERSKSLLQQKDRDQLSTLVQVFSQTTNNRFTIIDSQGVVLADSHENARQMSNHLQRPEVQNALASGSGQISRFSQTIGEDLIYYALPVYQEGELIGFVRSAYFIDAMASQIMSGQNDIDRVAFISAILGIFLIALIALMQARSVEKLALIATDISAGNFKGRVPENNGLGLKKLAKVINQLARNSAANISDITADRNRLATIFAGMVEGVIDVDQNQKILHINEAAANLLGVNVSESAGKTVWQEIRQNEIVRALDQAIKSQAVVKTQIKLFSSDSNNNEESIVDIYAASLSDDTGQPIGAVVVLHDISELKSLERIRTDFVANASHELKTPITAIRGLSESVIDDKDIDSDTLMHFISRIHSQSIRLSQLVGDLMALSRLEVDFDKKQFSFINMNLLIKNSVKLAEVAVEQKNQKLLVNFSRDNIYVNGDRQNLSQLIDNLIDNAIKYTPENGQVIVNLSIENDKTMLLEVSDTGIGISPQYQQRIFERFYRVDKARSRSLGGTGLGLAIVKNIAEKHSGSIQLKSQAGRGSTFSYRMPLADDAELDKPVVS